MGEEKVGGELVVREEGNLINDDDLIMLAETAEKRIAAVKKIITLALKVTTEKDWVNQGKKPYLQGDGAEAVANLFGISWRFIEKPEKVAEEEGHYRYEAVLEVSFRGRTIEVMGARSTKDTFFSTRYKWDEKEKKKMPFQLPISEIDSADVMKASVTNAIANGVTRILGIRNASWAMLKEAGLDIDKISKVDYGTAPEMSSESKDIKVETHKMLVALYGENYSADLEKITGFNAKDGKAVPGVRTLDVSEKRLQVIYGKVKEMFEKKPQPPAGSGATPQGTESKDEIVRKDLLAKINVAKKEVGEKEYTRVSKERKVESLALCDNGELENLLDDLRALWMTKDK